MSSEHRNRTNKAQAITAILTTVGCDADTARNLDDTGWRLAALCAAERNGTAWTDASPATRRMVIRMLADAEQRRAEDAEGLTAHRTDDVFAQIAAGSGLPRPAQDPDRAPRVSVAGVVDLHPAARHTLNCVAGFTPCRCD